MLFIADRASGELRAIRVIIESTQGAMMEDMKVTARGRDFQPLQAAMPSRSSILGRSWPYSVATDVMEQARSSLQATAMANVGGVQ